MYIHPQEGASPCGFYINHLDQFMQIHIPRVHIGILRGKYFNQSNQNICKITTHRERAKIQALEILTNQN